MENEKNINLFAIIVICYTQVCLEPARKKQWYTTPFCVTTHIGQRSAHIEHHLQLAIPLSIKISLIYIIKMTSSYY